MNFVFFYPDEMRAESLSVYGHPLVQNPNFERLANEGTVFDNCFIQHTVCSPSRCCMMTGWYPHVNGNRTLWHLLQPHDPSLFKYLREAGYHVEWYGKNDLYSEDSFPLCVDNYDEKRGQNSGGNTFKSGEPGFYSFLHEPAPDKENTHDILNAQAGIDFLKSRKKGDKPFMLYLPLMNPHPAYAAPQPYHDMYDPNDIPPLRSAETAGKPDFHKLIQKYRDLNSMPEGTMEKIQAVYLGMCTYMDWVLGQVLDALDETGLAEDTAVFVFADHGDWAGDFGLVEKWPSGLDDTLTRVPLVARIPGGTKGHRVKEQVELFDIMPTVLDLAGVDAQHTHFARSLIPQLNGEAGDPDRAVFSEGGYDEHEPRCFEGFPDRDSFMQNKEGIYYPKGLQQQEHPESVCRSTMIRTLDHKLIRRTKGVNELYDLKKDPQELTNLYNDPEYSAVKQELEARMLDWYIHTADSVPLKEDNRGLPKE